MAAQLIYTVLSRMIQFQLQRVTIFGKHRLIMRGQPKKVFQQKIPQKLIPVSVRFIQDLLQEEQILL